MADTDPTLKARIERLDQINSEPHDDRAKLEEKYGQVWTTEELQRDFTVVAFLAPFVGVTRNSDGVEGTLEFTHNPRFYFNFRPAR